MRLLRKAAVGAGVVVLVAAALVLMAVAAAATAFLGVLCAATFVDHTPPHLAWCTTAVGAVVLAAGLLAPLARRREEVCADS